MGWLTGSTKTVRSIWFCVQTCSNLWNSDLRNRSHIYLYSFAYNFIILGTMFRWTSCQFWSPSRWRDLMRIFQRGKRPRHLLQSKWRILRTVAVKAIFKFDRKILVKFIHEPKFQFKVEINLNLIWHWLSALGWLLEVDKHCTNVLSNVLPVVKW